jgi:CheY-like chemotaxis protein
LAGAREEYLAAGMDGYLSKPLDPGMLFRALAAFDAPDTPEAPEPAAKSAINPIFDRKQLDTLCNHLPAERVNEFVTLFLEHVGEKFVEMRACQRQRPYWARKRCPLVD